MDKLFENLKSNAEKKLAITQQIEVGVSDDEMAIISKKSGVLGMSVGELIREYILTTAAFDNSPFEEKKGKGFARKVVQA